MAENYGFSWMGRQSSSQHLQSSTARSFSLLNTAPGFLSKGITERSEGSIVQKNDVEKQMEVVNFLKEVPNRIPVTAQKIAAATRINLDVEAKVREMLLKNPKVKVENDLYSYVSQFNIRDSRQLLALVERAHVLTWEEIRDSYTGIESDADALIRKGALICIENAETKHRVFFPRGRPFLTEVSGEFEVRMHDPIVQPTDDAHLEVRRGDAICLDGIWFRVPVGHGATPNTASSVRPVTKANKPIPNFTKEGGMPLDRMPLDCFTNEQPILTHPGAASTLPPKTVKAVKYGCSNDIRSLWEQTLQDMPNNDVDLKAALRKAGIKTGDSFGAKRPKRFMKQEKKKRKRISNRPSKITNTHLAGSEVADALAEYEKQKQQAEMFGL